MIEELTEELTALPETVWAEVFRGRDLFADRISREDYWNLYQQAVKEARQLAQEFQGIGPDAVAEVLQVSVQPMPGTNGEAEIVFGLFTEPDRIEIQEEAAQSAQMLLDEINPDILKGTSVRDILLAHEIYHRLQLLHPELMVNQKHVTTFQLGRLSRRATLGSLEEAGAMTFARELLALDFQPAMLDIFLCMERFPERSRELIQYIRKKGKEVLV